MEKKKKALKVGDEVFISSEVGELTAIIDRYQDLYNDLLSSRRKSFFGKYIDIDELLSVKWKIGILQANTWAAITDKYPEISMYSTLKKSGHLTISKLYNQ